jgi:hypothetical protein
MTGHPAALGVGDRVRFNDDIHTVTGLAGTSVRLLADGGQHSVILFGHLTSAPGFELLGAAPAPSLSGLGLLDGLPDSVMTTARAWEHHVVEVDTGLPPDAAEAARPRPEYDPETQTVRQRETAKAAELTASGTPTSSMTVRWMRRRYREQGLWGLVDQRSTRVSNPLGRADSRLVAAITTVVNAETNDSTGDKGRLRRRVIQQLADQHGPDVVTVPPPSTFNRLANVVAAGRHTFDAATTRRTQANKPTAPYTPTTAERPGEIVQIDSTPLDVIAVLDNGVTGRVELTTCVDVATRTLCAAVLRPVAAEAVDAALLLARMLVPQPMRPGWAQALAMTHSRLPHDRLLSLDARLEQAAAKPVIVPETIACDRGKVFISDTFLSACQNLGISVQPARPQTPTDKGIVERTFASINTLFTQHLAGYTGANVAHRGADADTDAVWTLADLQDLLDEWVVASWQHRPHDGLRHPDSPRLALSPNEMYAALVAVAGYVPVSLSGEDYVELLPTSWRAINDYGIQIDYRTYDSPDLGPFRRRPSGVVAKRGLWEVHYDPYDVSHVWLRHPDGGFCTVPWTHLPMVQAPFADFTWRQARRIAAARDDDPRNETALARLVDELLHRAADGPLDTDRAAARVTARDRSAASLPLRPLPAANHTPNEAPPDEDSNDRDDRTTTMPFGVFDPDTQGDYG